MKSRHITIKDIARTLGISASTVSRALADHPDISQKTKDQVKHLAESVNYRPNALALGLKHAKTNTIGIVVPEIVHHFFSTVLSGIDDAAYERGYSTILCQTNENGEREKKCIQTLVDSRVDGLLISVSKTTTDISHLEALVESDLPCVFFDRVAEQIESTRVVCDDFHGAKIATKHLIDKGCKRIMLCTGNNTLKVSRDRTEGYKSALSEVNLEIDESLIVDCDSVEKVREMSDTIIKIAPEIDGIFAINDDTALALMKLLKLNNFCIPDDIAVIGFGDSPRNMMVEPTLSSVEQKGYEMGRMSAEILINQIEKDVIEVDFETRVFTPVLIERESTRR